MSDIPRKPVGSPSALLLLVVLICTGFAANMFAPDLFVGFHYLFGSIFTLMILRLYGVAWGMLATVIAAAATYFQFGNLFAVPWLCAEPLFVGWLLVKGKTRNLIFFDAVYWPLLGAPLVWIAAHHAMHASMTVSVAAALLYWITGITNALLASMLMTHAPNLLKSCPQVIPVSHSIHQLIFNVLMTVVSVPAIIILVIHGRDVEQRCFLRIYRDLTSSARSSAYEIRLKLRDRENGAERLTPPELRAIFTASRYQESINLTLLDRQGLIMGGTKPGLAVPERFNACPDGMSLRKTNSELLRCAPERLAQLPLWLRPRNEIYSVAMPVPGSAGWRIIAETAFEPYLILLITEYGKALLIVLCTNMLALILSLFISRRLAAPLRQLSDITTDLPNRIPCDDVHTALPQSMVAEIDRLSDNFRAMATALSAKFQEISLYNETLEASVRARTWELTRANEELKRKNAERRTTEMQRDQLMDELINQLRLLQKIIDAIPNPIFYRNIDGVYQGCNQAFETNWGLSREEIVGKTVHELFPERIAEKFQVAELPKPGQTGNQIIETQLSYADGFIHEVIIYKATYDDTRGNLAGVVGNIVDISPRKKAEAERDRLVVELQQKNKELEGIVYVASHDLRSPLVNIQGFSRKLAKSCAELEQLLAPLGMDDAARRSLEQILRESVPKSLGYIVGSVEKMDVILKGLLRLSRLGRVALCFDALDMNAIMESIVASMKFQIDAAGAQIEIGTLAGCTADAGQINQVFSNLLDNALKYRAPERPLAVHVSSEEFDEGVRYCVEDNGIGIPREQQETIWEIFQRLNPDDSPGEGLGLTMARRIISRMGGSIWVESEADQGARFYVVIPKVRTAR